MAHIFLANFIIPLSETLFTCEGSFLSLKNGAGRNKENTALQAHKIMYLWDGI
jgi:hypothetical protein